jgi:hypothetical protein
MFNLVMVENECIPASDLYFLLICGLIYVSLQIMLLFHYTLSYLKKLLPLKLCLSLLLSAFLD